MDAAARWLRDNDPEYKKDMAIRKRKKKKADKAIEEGNLSRSNTRRQMRGVVSENLDGKAIKKTSGKRPRGKRGGRNH